jgi:hypothetical protein
MTSIMTAFTQWIEYIMALQLVLRWACHSGFTISQCACMLPTLTKDVQRARTIRPYELQLPSSYHVLKGRPCLESRKRRMTHLNPSLLQRQRFSQSKVGFMIKCANRWLRYSHFYPQHRTERTLSPPRAHTKRNSMRGARFKGNEITSSLISRRRTT